MPATAIKYRDATAVTVTPLNTANSDKESAMSTPIVLPAHPAFKNLTGQRFGRLVVESYAGQKPSGKQLATMWNCKCDCGAVVTRAAKHLGRGTASCGCLKIQDAISRATTHGRTRTLEYRSWSMMKNRCLNARSADYPEYGGRGITVCDRWMSFENFLADMGLRPSKAHSLDRYPNQNGNYEPGNCRWATGKQQSRNTRRNRIIEYNGQKKTVVEWEELYGHPHNTIYQRRKRGWSIERSITTPS